MSFWAVLLIGVGLSMDAFAVSVASGCRLRQVTLRDALRPGCWFGGFQALMPVLGWLGGTALRPLVDGVDHWIAFGLLAFVGGKMILEAVRDHGENQTAVAPGAQSSHDMFVLAVATSIDAFAVGISFSILRMAILGPAVLIGVVTFVFSVAGTLIGCKVGGFLKNKAGVLGGLVLIGIGVKILLQGLR